MKIPDPGGEVKVTLVLGCHDCTQLVEAVAKIDDIVRTRARPRSRSGSKALHAASTLSLFKRR